MKRLKAIIILLFTLLLLTGCVCKHDETKLINAVTATCQKEGYSGDTFCVECEKIILQGENVKMRPHTEGKVINVKEATCTIEGYTGDIYCTECGIMLHEGETVPALGHTEGDLVGRHEATCYAGGYTGNVYCTECNELLIVGQTIPMLSHDLELQEDAYEATCQQTGYSGTSVCKVCNALVYGETLPIKQHNYVNNSCTWCGWLSPGLYFEDELAMSWKDMEKNGYVTVNEKGQLISVDGDFSGGKLVIGEDVVYVDGNNYNRAPGIRYVSAYEVWLPRSITKLGNYLINHNEHIKNVVLYCNVDTVSSDCFSGARALESVVLPETVTVIGGAAFKNCVSLRELYLPESLTSIEVEAFYGCGLTEIHLPNTLKSIGLRAFARSSLKNIVIPESVTNIDPQVFQYCDSLISADMSAAQTTVLHFGLFEECPNLRELKLPECLESFDQYDIWAGHPATSYLPISKLVLPDGFKSFGGVRFKQLTEIVWPTSLIDGSSLLECPLRKIYYKGNEAQWKMVMGHDNFSNVTIVFNYNE